MDFLSKIVASKQKRVSRARNSTSLGQRQIGVMVVWLVRERISQTISYLNFSGL